MKEFIVFVELFALMSSLRIFIDYLKAIADNSDPLKMFLNHSMKESND